jgi:hypothetical protein
MTPIAAPASLRSPKGAVGYLRPSISAEARRNRRPRLELVVGDQEFVTKVYSLRSFKSDLAISTEPDRAAARMGRRASARNADRRALRSKNETYYAMVENLSINNYQIEGCRMPGGIAGSGIYFQWDVQRFNRSRLDWDSLPGANNWLPEPFASERWDGCDRGDIWPILPFSTRVPAWVFKSLVTKGDVVRMAIRTSLRLPTNQQLIIYTPTFRVEE